MKSERCRLCLFPCLFRKNTLGISSAGTLSGKTEKSWQWKAGKRLSYRWPVYSWNYGSELETLIGTSYSHAATQSEAKRYVGECLLVNPYIKGIKDLHTSFQEEKLNITFTAVTDYGEVMIHV